YIGLRGCGAFAKACGKRLAGANRNPTNPNREAASWRGIAESAPWMAHVPDSGHGWPDGGAETMPRQGVAHPEAENPGLLPLPLPLLLLCNRNGQWRKCRTPVNTIAMPCSSAAAITSLSRIEPPGWITALIPA